MQRYRTNVGHDTTAMVADPCGPWVIGDEADAEADQLQTALESALTGESEALKEVARLREEESTILDASLRLADERDAARAEAERLLEETAAWKRQCKSCLDEGVEVEMRAKRERDAARARVAELEGRVDELEHELRHLGD